MAPLNKFLLIRPVHWFYAVYIRQSIILYQLYNPTYLRVGYIVYSSLPSKLLKENNISVK